MEYEHNKILLQGNWYLKSIIIKKNYVGQIKFVRPPVNFNVKGLQLVLNEIILCN